MSKTKWISAIVVILFLIGVFASADTEPVKRFYGKQFVKYTIDGCDFHENSIDDCYTVLKELFFALDKMKGEEFAFCIKDLNSEWELGMNLDHRIYSASAIKGPYVISIIQKDPSVIGKSQRQIDAAITVSDNDSYKALRRTYGHPVFQEWLNAAGAGTVQMEDNFAYVTAKELADMWVATYGFLKSDNESAKYCRKIFEHVNHSFLSETLGKDQAVYSKAGWIAGTLYYAENDAGIVMEKDHPYVIAITSTACGRTDKLSRLALALHNVHNFAVHGSCPKEMKKTGASD